MSMFDLTGRVALVTGAASGIGKETAQVLAQLGATVVATDRDETGVRAVVQGLPPACMALRHDVTSVDDWAAALAAVTVHAGRLDVLVNNAGIMIKRGFLQTSLDDFRRQQCVNVESVFIGMQAALPLMQKTASERATTTSVINVSSVFGQVAGVDFSGYSATKGAVRMLTKVVAAEFAKAGVRVNSVHPGPTATRLGADFEPPTDANGRPLSAEEVRDIWQARIPAGRIGMPNDIAGAIAFLASDASRYVTGSELTVDGGYTAL